MEFDEIQSVATALGPLATFGTVDDDGTPHLVPVIASWVAGKLVFGSRVGSRKVRNLSDRPHASMHFATLGEMFPDAMLVKGRGRVVIDDIERAVHWNGGNFPYLPMAYSGPDDESLCFVEFEPLAAVIVRNGGRGPIQRWRAQASSLLLSLQDGG